MIASAFVDEGVENTDIPITSSSHNQGTIRSTTSNFKQEGEGEVDVKKQVKALLWKRYVGFKYEVLMIARQLRHLQRNVSQLSLLRR